MLSVYRHYKYFNSVRGSTLDVRIWRLKYWCDMAYVCCDMIILLLYSARWYNVSWLVAFYIGNGAHYNLWWFTNSSRLILTHIITSISMYPIFSHSLHMENKILSFNHHLKKVPFGFSYHAAMKFELEFEEGNMPWWWTSKAQCIMQEFTHTTLGS